MKQCMAFRSMLDAGIVVAAGSDFSQGRKVTNCNFSVRHAAASWHKCATKLQHRQPVFGGWRQEWSPTFRTEQEAKRSVDQRVEEKLSKGYKPKPTLRTAG